MKIAKLLWIIEFFALFALVSVSCKTRSDVSNIRAAEIDSSCTPVEPKILLDDPAKVGWGTRVLNSAISSPESFRKYTTIALGVYESPDYGNMSDLQRFGKKISGAYGKPAVSHWAFADMGILNEGDLPTRIVKGSNVDINYEKIFERALKFVVEEYYCDKHPAIYFNISAMTEERRNTFTSRELRLIFRKPEYLKRTRFYDFDRPVSETDVRRKLNALLQN